MHQELKNVCCHNSNEETNAVIIRVVCLCAVLCCIPHHKNDQCCYCYTYFCMKLYDITCLMLLIASLACTLISFSHCEICQFYCTAKFVAVYLVMMLHVIKPDDLSL